MQKVYKIKLKKNDEVIVLSGKDKGKIGKIVATHPNSNKVTVEGINIAKKHVKPRPSVSWGGDGATSRELADSGARSTEKIVPMETLTSMFDEPSRGSNNSR